MILHEYDRDALESLEKEPEALSPADAAAFTFDSGSLASFKAAHAALLQAARASGDTLPCLLIGVEGSEGMSQVPSSAPPVEAQAPHLSPPQHTLLAAAFMHMTLRFAKAETASSIRFVCGEQHKDVKVTAADCPGWTVKLSEGKSCRKCC